MTVPEPGKLTGIDTTLFYLHVTVFGWAAVIVGGVYAMSRFYEANAWGRLVPWFSKKYLQLFFKSAKKEVPGIFSGHLAPPEDKGALAGAVHGIGFILLLCLGLSGLYVLLGLRSDGTMSEDVLTLLSMHEICGIIVWAFLAAHILMTLYHLILGQRRILDIFQRGRIPWN